MGRYMRVDLEHVLCMWQINIYITEHEPIMIVFMNQRIFAALMGKVYFDRTRPDIDTDMKQFVLITAFKMSF